MITRRDSGPGSDPRASGSPVPRLAASERAAGTKVPSITLEGLEKRFGDVVAVAGIDLEVADGEFFSMLGPSGSGKTTTLRMVRLDGFQAAGHRIGLMLASVVNFFNPSLIVIGGGVAQSGDHLLASIRETVYRRSLPLATRDLLVQRSSLAGLAGVIGASAMVVDQLFSREHIARWAAGLEPFAMPPVATATG